MANGPKWRTGEVGLTGLAPATVLALDSTNDLALLQASNPLQTLAPPEFRQHVRLGEDIFVFGYPLTGIWRRQAISPAAALRLWRALVMIAASCSSLLPFNPATAADRKVHDVVGLLNVHSKANSQGR